MEFAPSVTKVYNGFLIDPYTGGAPANTAEVEIAVRISSDDASYSDWSTLVFTTSYTQFQYIDGSTLPNIFYQYRFREHYTNGTLGDWSDYAIPGTVSNSIDYGSSLDQLASKLGTITAGYLRGVIFETSANYPKVRMDPTGFYSISGSATPLFIDAATGNVTSIGGTFTGATFQTSANDPRVIFDSNGIRATDFKGNLTFNLASNGSLSLAIGDIGGANLLRDSSFEGTVWNTIWSPNNASIVASTTQARYGSSSLAVTHTSTDSFARSFIVDNATLSSVAGNAVTLSSWIYVPSAVGSIDAIDRSIFWLDGTTSASTPISILPRNAWTRVAQTINVATPLSTLEFRLYNPYATGGAVYYDGIQLEVGSIATSYAPKTDEILPGTITGGTGGSLAANTVTATNINVANLSAISADMGTITAGTLTAGTVFAGALSAATGTFAGSLSAATGSFSGSISGASGTFTGNLSGSSISGAAITSSTMTAGTFQTASSGDRTYVDSSGFAIDSGGVSRVVSLDHSRGLKLSTTGSSPSQTNAVQWSSTYSGSIVGAVWGGLASVHISASDNGLGADGLSNIHVLSNSSSDSGNKVNIQVYDHSHSSSHVSTFDFNGNIIASAGSFVGGVTGKGVAAGGNLIGGGGAGGNAGQVQTASGNTLSTNWTGSLLFYVDVTNVKTFVIEHPDKSDKYLVHSTIEGPEAAVYYRGEGVVPDAKGIVEHNKLVSVEPGVVWVNLPDYFESLTRKEGRTVQITTICEDPRVHAEPLATSRVRDGKFFVTHSQPVGHEISFYWEVKALRKDVPQPEVEPSKTEYSVAGDGPYTYLVKKEQILH